MTSTETEAPELSMDNLKQEAEENINELSSERYCNGATGVPITFLDKYNPEQFEIIKFRKGNDDKDLTYTKAKLESVQETGNRKQETGNRKQETGNHYSVLQDTYQKDTVTESLEHQSPSLINTTQNNLKSLERQNQKEKDLVTDCGLQNQESHSLLSASSENISVCLQERYCNGIAGVPITFLDKYSPEQFEIVNANDYRKTEDVPVKPHGLIKDKDASITFSETQKSIDKKESKNIIAKSRAEQSRAEQSRAEQSRAEADCLRTNLHQEETLNCSRREAMDGISLENGNMQGFLSDRYCNGVFGVPITFLDKYNPEQFRIIWQAAGNAKACCPENILSSVNYIQNKEDRGGCGVVNGKRVYARILIQKII